MVAQKANPAVHLVGLGGKPRHVSRHRHLADDDSRKLTGHHSLEFKIYTPKGNLYQSMTLQFDADAPIPEGARRRSRRFQDVNAVLPVAGTSIVTSSMYGTWTVEAFLDGDERRCSRPRRFLIQP